MKQGKPKTCIIRPYTIKQDAIILRRLKRGEIPKQIAHEMSISVWCVYDAVRRHKAALRRNKG